MVLLPSSRKVLFNKLFSFHAPIYWDSQHWPFIRSRTSHPHAGHALESCAIPSRWPPADRYVSVRSSASRRQAARRSPGNSDEVISARSRSSKSIRTIDQFDFRVISLGQAVNGTIGVADDRVRLEIALPWLFCVLG